MSVMPILCVTTACWLGRGNYGRQLQGQGQQAQAFEIFRTNIKRNPNHWVIHSEVARMACAKGDFESAVKEMKIAAAGAPPVQVSVPGDGGTAGSQGRHKQVKP